MDASESLFLAAMPMVLSASRIAQSPLDAPAAVTVLDRDTIRASGMTEIHDLFRLVPGFQVADWPRGSPMVVNHGLGDAFPRRMLVLVDGRNVLDGAKGNVDWQDLPIRVEDIERIEVVRGPNQASYGANAFQGVINIITLHPADSIGGGVIASVGENDYRDLHVRLGRRAERADWRISASFRQAENFADQGVKTDSQQETIERSSLYAQAAFYPDADSEVRAALGWGIGHDDVGGALEALDPPHTRNNRGYFMQVDWRRRYAPDSEVSLRASHAVQKFDEDLLARAGPLLVPLEYDIDSRRDAVALQQVHAFRDGLKGVWGAGWQRDRAKSDHYLYDLGSVGGDEWQAFGNLDWRLAPEWLLHLGGMVEDRYNTDVLFSPRVAVNFQPKPGHSFRVSGGRGYLAPTLIQTMGRETVAYRGEPFVVPGIGDLRGRIIDVGIWVLDRPDPQSQTFIEAGYVGEFPEVGLRVDARAFREEHRDYIDFTTCVLAGRFLQAPLCTFPPPPGYAPVLLPDKAHFAQNAGDIRVSGLDVTFDWQHPRWGRFLLSHAITDINAPPEFNDDFDVSAPTHSSSLLWSKRFAGGFDASVGHYRVGAMRWLGDGDIQPDYERTDLRLAKRFGKPGSNSEVALTVQNLNGDHVEFRNSSTVRRLAFLTLRLDW